MAIFRNRFVGIIFMTVLSTLVLGFAATAHGQGKKEKRIVSALTVTEAGPDYQIQGEYIGRLKRDGVDEMFGVQVIAKGAGKFDAVGYHGGLPGAGWDRSEKLDFHLETPEDAHTVLKPKNDRTKYTLTIMTDKKMAVKNAAGQTVGELVRAFRKSPTLGKKPPEGATVIFDGTTTDHVHYGRRNEPKPARMTEDGILMVPRGSRGLYTKKAFQDCKLHLEFYLPFQPHASGQGRANSGCYLQGRYEVQILDSFGLEGRHGECGGMYSIADPMVNAAFPPLTWQTFDIEFTAAKYGMRDGKRVTLSTARMTVYHNGILVHDDQPEKDRKTTAAPIEVGPEATPHYLQDHGHTIYFRNIWAVEK